VEFREFLAPQLETITLIRRPHTPGPATSSPTLGPPEVLAKGKPAHKIATLIAKRGLTQVQATQLLGSDQPKISALPRGKVSDFSIERPLRLLLLFGHVVKIAVRLGGARVA
jgi:predicted XRE-type DNA-binding protein